MIYVHYDTQSSFPGYIDMEFKELTLRKTSGLPIDCVRDLTDMFYDGYFPDFIDYDELPSWLENLGRHPESVKRRIVKKLASKIFDKYGDKESATKEHEEFIKHMEELELECPELTAVESTND